MRGDSLLLGVKPASDTDVKINLRVKMIPGLARGQLLAN